MTTEDGPAGGADVPRDPAHRKWGNTVDTIRVPQSHRKDHQPREVASRVPGYVLRVLRPHLLTKDPTPPGPLYALLSLSRSGVGSALSGASTTI
jgi:hypothetical protein